jgi:NAD+ synthase
LGTYTFILSILPFRFLQDRATRAYLNATRTNPFIEIMNGGASFFRRSGFARFTSKQRVRLVVTYFIAKLRNLLVVGSAHKSEDMLGLFVKFGVDDVADLMPLKNLYRSQILQLASFLGVPEEIIQRTPNPDVIPGVNDKYVDILGLPANVMDLLVVGIERGMDDAEISTQLQLPLDKVHQVRELVRQTEHMRLPSQTLAWD